MWDSRRERAARLMAEGQGLDGKLLLESDIAKQVGVGRAALTTWKTYPEFMARVEHHVNLIESKLAAMGIRHKANRLRYYDEMARRMFALMNARGEALKDEPDAPGGELGLQVKVTKVIGSGKYAQEITEFQYDTALIKDFMNVMKQSAIEFGDWDEKSGDKTPEQSAALVADPRQVLLDEVLLIRRRLKDSGVPVLGGDSEPDESTVFEIDVHAGHTNGTNGTS